MRQTVLLAREICAALGALAALAIAADASAHPLAPALLELREAPGDPAGSIDVRFRTSLFLRSREAASHLVPVLPETCGPLEDEQRSEQDGGLEARWRIVCPGGLVGREVGVDGLSENAIAAVVRVDLADGRRVQAVLQGGQARLRVPARPERATVAAAYLEMGLRHIFGGLDHLLFVFGLVLLIAPGSGFVRRLLWTLTAFTLGHCATLAAATLGWVRVPGPPIELAIAASVLALAVELARREQGAANRVAALPATALLAGGFGLLHGLGFAGALSAIGLPQGEIPLALLSFNLGIELGQVAFVALVLGLRSLLRSLGADARLSGAGGGTPGLSGRVPGFGRWIPVYAMGSLAGMWCVERAAALVR